MTNTTGRWGRTCGAAFALYLGSTAATLCAETARGPTFGGPEYEALGVPLGGFVLFPSLTAATTFDNNIRRTQENTLSDTFFAFSPALALRSRWAQHALNLSASSDTLVYAKYSSENVTNYTFSADGRVDVRSSLRIIGLVSYAQLYLPRGSPELPSDATKPLPYSMTRSDVAVEYQPARLGIEFGVGFEGYRYDSLDTLGGPEFSWEDQNRDVIIPRARLFYEFSPGYAAYIEARHEERNFELPVDRSGFNRSSQGRRLRGGVEAQLGNLIQGDAFLGYLNQQYAAPLEDISGLDFGASLDWFVTPLTTLHLTAARLVNDTTFVQVSATDDQSIGIGIDHELLRNLILRGNVGFTRSDFRGAPRTDQLIDVAFGAEYLMNRFFSVAARYAYQQRTSDVAGQGYTDNLFSIAIRGQL
jgi:hypothetical protein